MDSRHHLGRSRLNDVAYHCPGLSLARMTVKKKPRLVRSIEWSASLWAIKLRLLYDHDRDNRQRRSRQSYLDDKLSIMTRNPRRLDCPDRVSTSCHIVYTRACFEIARGIAQFYLQEKLFFIQIMAASLTAPLLYPNPLKSRALYHDRKSPLYSTSKLGKCRRYCIAPFSSKHETIESRLKFFQRVSCWYPLGVDLAWFCILYED